MSTEKVERPGQLSGIKNKLTGNKREKGKMPGVFTDSLEFSSKVASAKAKVGSSIKATVQKYGRDREGRLFEAIEFPISERHR